MSSIRRVFPGIIREAQTGTTQPPAGAQFGFFENIRGGDVYTNLVYSNAIVSFHNLNVPGIIPFGVPVCIISHGNATGSMTVRLGLYSLDNGSLTLVNSAIGSTQWTVNTRCWVSMLTSSSQNVSPGQWYYGIAFYSAGNSSFSIYGNSSINIGNAEPSLIMGRMTATSANMPLSIATSLLDITGSDATRQMYVILSA